MQVLKRYGAFGLFIFLLFAGMYTHFKQTKQGQLVNNAVATISDPFTLDLPHAPHGIKKQQVIIKTDGPGYLFVNGKDYWLADGQLAIDLSVNKHKDQWLQSSLILLPSNKDKIKLRLEPVGTDPLTIISIETKNLTKKHVTSFNKTSFLIFLIMSLACVVLMPFMHAKQRLSQWVLVSASGLFILYNDVVFAICLFAMLGFCYVIRPYITVDAKNKGLKIGLVIAVIIVFLLFFKYTHNLMALVFANPGRFGLVIPIGASYFMIRLLDTALRWHRKEPIPSSLREYLCFILFPGTLIAGPIETIDKFYANRLQAIKWKDYSEGSMRIVVGLFKKIVIADYVIAANLYGGHSSIMQAFNVGPVSGLYHQVVHAPETVAHITILMYSCLFFLFAYVDFSAYSDIAIGASRLMGYKISENFNYPFLAKNISDYWKRWHMTLSSWCMRNIFFPLMIKLKNTTLPMYLTMFLIGAWHMMSLNWMSWALHHGTGLSVHAWVSSKLKWKPSGKIFRVASSCATLLFVMAGYCLVSIYDIDVAWTVYRRFFTGFLGF